MLLTILQKYLFWILLCFSTIFVLIIHLNAEATFDYGDGIQHYLISKYSWKHPELILDLWGKPLFTLLSSPFAQFGLKGMMIFQIIISVFTSIFTYLIANKFNLKYSYLAPILIFFSPIYFAVLNSGLTEILFGLVIILTLWLLLNNQYLYAAILFSFSPFVRPESYFIFPLLTIYFIFKKQYKIIPFFFTGFVIFTIIGYFYFNDFLWIIHNNYQVGQNYPQKGEFLHYFNQYDNILGKLNGILFLTGFITILFEFIKHLIKKSNSIKEYSLEKIIIIYGSIFIVFSIHTLMNWMPGINSNLGMLRYLTSIIPLSALISLHAFQLLDIIPILKKIKSLILILISTLIINEPFNKYFYPFRLSNEQIVINQSAKFLSNFNLKNKTIIFLHPQLPVSLDIDPFDKNHSILMWALDVNHIDQLPDSTLIVWDSHFSPLEGNVPVEKLKSDTSLKLLKHFKFIDESYPFETLIFIKSNKNIDLNVQPEYVAEQGIVNLNNYEIKTYNFDTLNTTIINLSTEKSLSGKYSLKYSSENEWGNVFTYTNIQNLIKIKIQFSFIPIDTLKETFIITHIKDTIDNSTLVWFGDKLSNYKLNEWNQFETNHAFFNNKFNQKSKLDIYFWNKSKKNFYIDDLKITFYYSK
ncbi:MAG TPA: glycosyltransferase family 87 protein [Bacteroidia bacterium]|nr:glycosyltransferase family 87 protein [Bacteroidia bacterium]